ncbi:MAG: hypothetical protein ACETV0_05485, partial [Nitrososphaeria archaeon]
MPVNDRTMNKEGMSTLDPVIFDRSADYVKLLASPLFDRSTASMHPYRGMQMDCTWGSPFV